MHEAAWQTCLLMLLFVVRTFHAGPLGLCCSCCRRRRCSCYHGDDGPLFSSTNLLPFLQVKGSIKVLNNGAGIPVEIHKTEVGLQAACGLEHKGILAGGRGSSWQACSNSRHGATAQEFQCLFGLCNVAPFFAASSAPHAGHSCAGTDLWQPAHLLKLQRQREEGACSAARMRCTAGM